METVHTLVAEVLANLINALKAAYDKAFEVELSGDTHVHVDVQRIEVRDERLCTCSAWDILQYRSLYLGIAAVVEELTHSTKNDGTLEEGILHTIVDDEVDVALTGPLLGVVELIVGHSVLIFDDRQRLKTLGEQLDILDVDGYFAHLSAEHIALHTDNVTDVEEFLEHLVVQVLILAGAQIVTADI